MVTIKTCSFKTGNRTRAGTSIISRKIIMSELRLDVLIHELVHAFQGTSLLQTPHYIVEGFARAVEVEVMNRLKGRGHRYFDYFYSYTYDVFYEGLDKPNIATSNLNSLGALALLRYQMAGYT